MSRVFVALLCCVFLIAAGLPTSATVQNGYSLTISGSIETAERTVTVDSSQYTVDSIARVQQGTALNIESSGPAGESYDIYIYTVENGSQKIFNTKYIPADSNGNISIDTSSYSAGSYVVTVYKDGTYYDPHPMVIPAYAVDLSAPGTITTAESGQLSASVTEVAPNKTIGSVEFVVSNKDTTSYLEATQSNNQYTHTLDGGSFAPGEYNVYAVVYSPESAPGPKNEVIGISDRTSITIENPSTSTSTTTTNNQHSSTSPPTSTNEETATEATTTRTTVPTTDATTTVQSSTTTSHPTSSTQTTEPPTNPQTTLQQSTTKMDSVITPGSSTAEPSPPSSSNGVVGETPLVLLALLAVTALFIRRPH